MKRTHAMTGLLAAIILSFSAASTAADETSVDANSVILSGYDAVTYFTADKPIKGYAGISTVHNGAIYHFSSEANRDAFNANPDKYAPQYGGFCAYGAALGRKFPVDPTVFEVVNDKLYVNNSAAVAETWNEERDENILEADSQWKKIKSVAASEL